MWIDSHCHLNHERAAPSGDADAIAARARTAGVDGMVNISTTIRGDFPAVLDTARRHDDVWCTIGTHPHDASAEEEKAISLNELVSMAQSDSNIIGIGESGLDYYYNYATPEDQQASFRKHIQACIETDLPLVVHARDADEDIIRIIREEGGHKAGLRGVLHCFSSGRTLAQQALEEGFYVSFSGIVTFRKSTELQDIAKAIPLDRILVETDAPFLAPEPFRSKTNEPGYVQYTGTFLANLHSISPENMATHCKNNFFNLFNRAKK